MNAKAIALFAVLAVALTGGFAIVGADAADADDFKAEYMTAGPLEGVQITFDVAPYDKIDWLGTVYGDEGTIVKNVLLKFDGNKTAIAWKAKPLAVGTYQVEITDKDQTTTYKGSFVVPEKFTVTFAVDDAVVKTLTVEDGDYIAADQLPEDPVKGGQDFVGWALDGATVAFDFVNTPITQDYDFKALFKPKEYTIAVDPAIVNGTVTPSKAVAAMGETIMLTVTPAEGYQTVSVTVNGAAIEGTTFEMPAENVTVSATFEPKEYTITIDSAIVNGTVIPDKEKATAGETVTLTVTPAEGYQTVSVTFNGEAVEGNTFEMPANDVTVSATFELKDYTITVDPEIQNGTVTPSKLKAKAGEAISLTVLPAEGYQVASVTLDGAALEEYAFTMPGKDVTVSATFELKDYTITVDPAIVNGTVIPDKEKAKMGDTVTLTVTPAEGYQIASVTVDGKEIEEPAFTMPNKNVTVSATFELKEYTITVDPEIVNGTVTPDKERAKAGETVTLTVKADDGYQPVAVTVNGTAIEGTSFEMPESDVTVSATFELIPVVKEYTITVDSEIEGGDVTPDTILAAEGDTVTLSYTKDEGFTFVSYYAYTESTETPITVSDDGTFTMPADDVIVGAIFLPDVPVKKYTVTVMPSENGTASADVAEAEEGDTVTITAAPADGYQTVAIYLDGQPLEVVDDEAYFLMPAKNVEVSAVFAEIPVGGCTVTYVDVKGVIETVSYEIGKEVVYPVTVPEGMKLDSVDFEPDMYCLIDHEACTVEFTAAEGNYIATISYIAPYTVYLVDQDGKSIDNFQYFAEEPVEIDMGMYLGVEVESVISEPEIDDLECEDGVITFTMPAQDVTVTVTLKPIVPETATVVFMDGEIVIATETVVVGSYLTKIPNDPVHEGKIFLGWCREGSDVPYDFATMPVLENMTLVATYEDAPVEDVTLTFRVEGAQYAVATFPVGTAIPEDKIPEKPIKEGYNFVGWFKEGYEQSFDFATPVYEDVTLFAKFIETHQIEGFAILYHDMYQGEPVDIWWKGYTSKDDRVMLANGMDATPGVVFKGWLAEDQKTLLTWNAAYDLNDIERNDCLIYPAYYGYPGTDGIYELNAIYELHIQWIGFDGETVIDEQDVIRGAFLEPTYSDEDMTAKLEQEMPSDKEYKYSWTGWRIGDSETTYTSEQIGSVKVDGAWKIYATYGKDLNEYDITFNWHDDTSTIQVAYGDTPEIENPPAYEDDNFTYTFAGWDPEVKKVDGDATYTATYDKTSKTKDVTITVNDFAYGYFTYNDEKQTADYILKVPMDAEAPVIDGNVLTFDFVRYEGGDEVPETHVFTAFPNPDDTMHYEFVEWTVSEDGNTYTANFVTDIITSKDLDRIQTFFDYTDDEDGDFIFTMKSKDGLAIPKGKLVVKFYEYAYVEEVDAYVQIEDSFDAIEMDWGTYYGDNLISMTIEYADLTQDGAPVDLTTKNINTMWLVFDGYNEAHCESNKATPGQ
jgi:uncharacterized repeat protein (TIGR02543 family)